MGKARDQRSEIRGRKSDGKGQRSEVGDRRLEITKRKTKQFDITIKDTFDLIRKIQNNELPDKIMINVHPQRWNDAFIPWLSELVRQNVKNVVKKQINRFRN
jgi:type VI protein secretion system component VasK